jgi:hypothetical protein
MVLPSLFTYRTSLLGASCALVVLGVAALWFSVPGRHPQDYLARHWERQVVALPDTEVLPQMRKISRLNDEGMACIVRLLANPREAVADSAQVALAEQLQRWRMSPVEISSPKALHLAKQLSQHLDKLSPRRRRFAADVCTQLLLWPATNAAQAEHLLTHCEAVLLNANEPTQDSDASPRAEDVITAALPAPPLPAMVRKQVPRVATKIDAPALSQ